MKRKIFISSLILVIFSIISIIYINNSWILSNTWSNDIKLYTFKVDNNFTFDWDLLLFDRMISNDINFFNKNKEEIDFFFIWRNYLYWDKYGDINLNNLLLCLDWKKSYNELDWFYKEICKWDNKYIKDSDTNFFHIKDTLIKFKKLKDFNKWDCSYFLDLDYEYPKDEKHFQKKNDYMICNKILKQNDYNFKEEIFYYQTAIEKNLCIQLKDKNLVELCNYERKINNPKFKK